jgi:hypothetical protein
LKSHIETNKEMTVNNIQGWRPSSSSIEPLLTLS